MTNREMNWEQFTQAVIEYPLLPAGVSGRNPDGTLHPQLQAWHDKWEAVMQAVEDCTCMEVRDWVGGIRWDCPVHGLTPK